MGDGTIQTASVIQEKVLSHHAMCFFIGHCLGNELCFPVALLKMEVFVNISQDYWCWYICIFSY